MSPAVLRGSAQFLFDCVSGVSTMVEGMHRNIATTSTSWLGVTSEALPVRAIRNPPVYPIIQHINHQLGNAVTGILDWRQGKVDLDRVSDEELRWVAALNGVCGDHLEATGNVLAQPMSFVGHSETRIPGMNASQVNFENASPHIVVLVHGLCLSDRNWGLETASDLGQRIGDELDFSPVYLRYNTGRHISTNGQELAIMLDDLVENWPVPVESLSVVGHSMGGLVLRSACWYAEQKQRPWLKHLSRVVFLGTPHHGSPVEKAGHALDVAMRSIKYVAPLMVGNKRSAGIKDLRHGNLLDEDWQNVEQDVEGKDTRRPVPLLPGVEYFLAAATVGDHPKDPKSFLLGDMLVREGSATGSHSDELQSLPFNEKQCRVFREQNHFDLLTDERVHQQVINWLAI